MVTICIPCGYIYEGKTAFESLPEDWCCPECGGSIKHFSQIEEILPEKKEQIKQDL